MPRLTQYDRMREDHGNPLLRPSVDKLRTKLRAMSILQNKPEATFEIIKDMSHWYFVHQQQRPWELHRLIMHMMLQLEMVLGHKLEDREAYLEAFAMGEEKTVQEVTPVGEPELSGGAPSGIAGWINDELEAAKKTAIVEFINSDDSIRGIELVVRKHQPRYYGQMQVRCECGRFYDDVPQWVTHVGIRIRRRLANEFKPDQEEVRVENGEEATAQGGS